MKFNVDRSREVRLWIGTITSVIGGIAAIDISVNGGKWTKKVVDLVDIKIINPIRVKKTTKHY